MKIHYYNHMTQKLMTNSAIHRYSKMKEKFNEP